MEEDSKHSLPGWGFLSKQWAELQQGFDGSALDLLLMGLLSQQG